MLSNALRSYWMQSVQTQGEEGVGGVYSSTQPPAESQPLDSHLFEAPLRPPGAWADLTFAHVATANPWGAVET